MSEDPQRVHAGWKRSERAWVYGRGTIQDRSRESCGNFSGAKRTVGHVLCVMYFVPATGTRPQNPVEGAGSGLFDIKWVEQHVS